MVDENTTSEAAETSAAAPETSAADEFAAAFAQFASPGEKPEETVSVPDAEVQEAPPADAEAGDETAPDEDGAGHASADGAAPAQTAPEPARLTADEWARVMAAQQSYQQAPHVSAPSAPERSPPPPVLSKEEVETIQEFRKEWPDVAKAMDVQQKAFANDLLNYVFNQFAEVMTPALQQVESVAERTHVMDIYDFVPDYDNVREPVIEWVARMPQNAFRQYAVSVVEQGSPADIQGLVNQWRMFTGQQAPAPQAQAAPGYAPAPRAPAVQRRTANPALARAAAAMAPVKSQRTTVVQTEDPNDFDGAFERAAAAARQAREARH